jgi:hypothetical protein
MPPASFCCPTYFGSTKRRSAKRSCFRQYDVHALHNQQKSSDKQVISYTGKGMWCGKELTCARPPLGRLGASSRWRTQCSTLRLGCCASSLRSNTHKTQELPVSVCGFGAFYAAAEPSSGSCNVQSGSKPLYPQCMPHLL